MKKIVIKGIDSCRIIKCRTLENYLNTYCLDYIYKAIRNH